MNPIRSNWLFISEKYPFIPWFHEKYPMSLYSNLLQGTCTTKALWFLFHTDLLELNSSKIDRLPRNRSRTWNGRKRFFIGGEGVGKMAIRLKTVPGRNCKKCRKLFESGSAASDFQQLECNTILIFDIFFHSERLFCRVVHKLCNRSGKLSFTDFVR